MAMSDLRIGNAERENAATQLAEHFSAGRLDASEFDDRTRQAYSAKTAADLVPIFADLPGHARPLPSASPNPVRFRGPGWSPRGVWVLMAALLVLGFVVSLASTGHGQPPLILIPVAWLLFGRRFACRRR
jgi:hypothetical protein